MRIGRIYNREFFGMHEKYLRAEEGSYDRLLCFGEKAGAPGIIVDFGGKRLIVTSKDTAGEEYRYDNF